MSQLKVKLSLDAAAFSDGIKQATASTKEYTNQLTNITKNLPNAKREMNQMRKEAANLALVISRMSEAEKQSAEGQALIQHFNKIREEGAKMIDTIGDINAEMRAMASDTAGLDAARQAVGMFGNALSSVAGVIGLVTGEEEKMKKAVVMFTTVQSTLNTITSISTALNKSSILVLKTKALQQKAAAMAVKMETVAQNGNVVATKAATLAQKAFNAVAKANPIGLLITALVTVVSLFTAFASGADDATESLGSLKDGENDLATETGRLKDAQEKAGQVAGELSSKYEVLRMKYLSCKTDMERTQFIQQNKTGFEELGVEVNNLTDAYDFLVRKAPEVRRALMMISVAKGMQQGIENYVAKWNEQQAQNPITQPDLSYNARFKASRDMSGRYIFNSRDAQWMKEAGITGDNVHIWDPNTSEVTLDLQGIMKARDYWYTKIAQMERERQNDFLSVVEQMQKNWEKWDAAAEAASANAGINYANGDIIKPDKPKATPTPRSTTNRTTNRKSQNRTQSTRTSRQSADDKKKEIEEVKSAREQELESLNKREKSVIDQMYNLEKANKKDTQEYRNKEAELIKIRKRVEDINNIGKNNNADDLSTSIDKQKKLISSLEEQKAKLQDKDGNPTDEAEWNRLENEINEATTLLDYMQARLDGVKMTKFKELENEFNKIKTAYEKALENDPYGKLEETQKLKSDYEKKLKEYTDTKNQIETSLEITIDPKEDYMKKIIDEIKTNIENIDLEIELNVELNELDKGKLKNQRDEYQRQLNKWQSQYDKYTGKIEPETIELSGDSNILKESIVKGKLNTTIEEEISKIDWSKAAEGISEGFDLSSVMGDRQKMLYDTKTKTDKNTRGLIDEIVSAVDAGTMGQEDAQKYIDAFNDYRKNVKLEPIEINIKKDKLFSDLADIGNQVSMVANSIGEAFSAINDLFNADSGEDNKDFQIGKIIAQSVANIALSFSQAMAKHKSATVWDWIAAGIAGTAQMVAMIAQIKKLSKAEGYAEGGIVGGHSYYGDKIIARVNSQEAIFTTQQQKRIWEQMNTPNSAIGTTHVVVEGKIRGSDIILVQKNHNSKSNKAR